MFGVRAFKNMLPNTKNQM